MTLAEAQPLTQQDEIATRFPISRIAAANVSQVPQRSPLRYPGGKTWLIPHVREWLTQRSAPASLLFEPFAGGGIVSLTAVMEGHVQRAMMVERDRDVAAFWHALLEHGKELAARVRDFQLTPEGIQELLEGSCADVVDHGFRTLVLNRTRRGGVLAAGASLIKHGENGKGLQSRWYSATLQRRIEDIAQFSDSISFLEGDGAALLEALGTGTPDLCVFVDPPYTARGGKRAGRRLYSHNGVDHGRLFDSLARSGVDFLMTYDCADEIADLIDHHGFFAVVVMMKSGHHASLPEFVISRDPIFQ